MPAPVAVSISFAEHTSNDTTGTPLRHPQVKELFVAGADGRYRAKFLQSH